MEAIANELLRTAHAATYRLPDDFGGYRAHVVVSVNGVEAAGSVIVGPSNGVDVHVDDPDAFPWTIRQVESLTAERRPLDYERAAGSFAKTIDPDDGHPMGRLVRVGDPCKSSYRIDDGVITQVESTLGRDRLILTVQARGRICDGRSVPLQFCIGHFDAVCGTLRRTETFCDRYVGVDGTLLPAARQVVTIADGTVTVGRIRFDHHTLLSDRSGSSCPHRPGSLAEWVPWTSPAGLAPGRN